MAIFEIEGRRTNLANRYAMEALTSSFHFMVTDFAIGDQGHDPANIGLARSPNAAMLLPNDGLPLLFGPEPLDGRLILPSNAVRFVAVLERTEAVGFFSQICLMATVTEVPDGADDLPAVGEQFVWAVVNRPLTSKTDTERNVYGITVRR